MVLCLIGADRYFLVSLGISPPKPLLLLRFYMGYGSEFESLALTAVQQNVFRSAFLLSPTNQHSEA